MRGGQKGYLAKPRQNNFQNQSEPLNALKTETRFGKLYIFLSNQLHFVVLHFCPQWNNESRICLFFMTKKNYYNCPSTKTKSSTTLQGTMLGFLSIQSNHSRHIEDQNLVTHNNLLKSRALKSMTALSRGLSVAMLVTSF